MTNITPVPVPLEASNYIYAEEWGHGTDPLLMLHGFMMRGEMYYPLVYSLGLDFKLLIPDLRGFGKSKYLGNPYTISQMADDLIPILELYGIKKFHLLGYSMGGGVAQQFALRYPERLKSLALCCTFAHKTESALERLERQWITTVLKRLGSKGVVRLLNDQLSDIVGKVDTKTFAWYKKMLADNQDDILIKVAHDLFKIDFRKDLKKIQIPTLVVGAAADVVAPLHHTYYLAGNIPKAKLKVFQNAGHGLLHSHTTQFINTYLDFINGLNISD